MIDLKSNVLTKILGYFASIASVILRAEKIV